jgi:hypothetical protein
LQSQGTAPAISAKNEENAKTRKQQSQCRDHQPEVLESIPKRCLAADVLLTLRSLQAFQFEGKQQKKKKKREKQRKHNALRLGYFDIS